MNCSKLIAPGALLAGIIGCGAVFSAVGSPFLYGIHDHEPDPGEFLNRVRQATGAGAWVTATVAVGANTNDLTGTDFTPLANQGHTVICRINHGYFPNGTIPLPARYDDFAKRCANFVAHSAGCSIWIIGNELNIAGEWPVDFNTQHAAYVSPSNYAACFRNVCNAIKAVQPNAAVLPQAPAPFCGPYAANSQNLTLLGNRYTHDANPLNCVQHLRQMLIALTNTGPLDGIALHTYSRGYAPADVLSTAKFTTGGGAGLHRSFLVYRDWIDLGIPPELYRLPIYITECNGYYFWSGGHPEDASKHYESGWVQEVYAEINRHNQKALTTGKPIIRCLNLYRWCATCDGWKIDGSPFKAQILADLDAAAAQKYAWPTNRVQAPAPAGLPPVRPAR